MFPKMLTNKSITSIKRIYKFLSVENVLCEVGNIFYTQFRSVSVLRDLIFFPYSKFFGSKPRISVIRHYTLVTLKCCSFWSTSAHGTALVWPYCRFYGSEEMYFRKIRHSLLAKQISRKFRENLKKRVLCDVML